MRLAELQSLAQSMGLPATSGMRKGDLIQAIKERQAGSSQGASRTPAAVEPTVAAERPQAPQPEESLSRAADSVAPQSETVGESSATGVSSTRTRRSRRVTAPAAAPERREEPVIEEISAPAVANHEAAPTSAVAVERGDRTSRSEDTEDGQARRRSRRDRQRDYRQGEGSRTERSEGYGESGRDRDRDRDRRVGSDSGQSGVPGRQGDTRRPRDDDEDGRGGRRRNRQRSRDRKRRGGRGLGEEYSDQMESFTEDDVLVPIAGILDVLDNYAFVRTSGYLPGPNDVYVPLGIVKRHGLRKGDAVTGAVKALREGEQLPARQKFNALVRLDTVNGGTPDASRGRVEFNKLTPLYPQERLRLETEPNIYTTRIIDLVSPIGKGQRGLIVSPPKAGKTLILQAIANAITKNNPEAHLMVVLVDERPEEVTDMQRTVKGEVIASTFDRPADDHTTVAELAIERAKRLVELGHDVVVLLDSITRLGRAYNLAAPASGRILSGGVDSSALYPPKRFFGAARNIENGGSLTILATALVETGSKMDEVIFEEFKGTGNMELRLSRQLADRRIFPAVDVNPSGTRREEILMSTEELKLMWKLRRILSALEPQAALELLVAQMKKTKHNAEFLMMVQRNSSIKLDDED
ncbi:transcription termination factor Rho [Austwickia sp. TVS 96-490-7B]|uniref:transcription termination factor Rho n=1 Tax=Austwickia sp. TVS 96-490-7B TaxID=2830843 RepID=UPI001C58D3B9|nr:transcription termination factor Rho [Austwickia sp. TVS 96-490-7B]